MTAPLLFTSPTTTPAQAPVIDPAALQALGRLSPQSSQAFVLRVLGTYRASLLQHRALVLQAASPLNPQAVAASAHALKAASASVGAQALSALCQQVEQVVRQGTADPLALMPELVPALCEALDQTLSAVDTLLQERQP